MASGVVDRILAQLVNVKSNGKGWSALCPAHDDHKNSLSINEGEDGRALLKCFAGCKPTEIVSALGLSTADLFPPGPSRPDHVREIVATYDYLDAGGRLLFQVVRYNPKTFKQRRPGPGGKWIWNLKDVERVLYRLPELLTANPAQPVFVVEGEKDADRLAREGLVATTNSGGAGKWSKEYGDVLRGRDVVVIPDNDVPGRRHAEEVATSLFGVARSIKVISL